MNANDLLDSLREDKIETTPLAVLETEIYRLLVATIRNSDYQQTFFAEASFLNILFHANYRIIGKFVGRQIAGIRLRGTEALSSTDVSQLSIAELTKIRHPSKTLLLRSYLYAVREVAILSPSEASSRFLISTDFTQTLAVWTPMQVESFIGRSFDSCVFEITCPGELFARILSARSPREVRLRRLDRELRSTFDFART